MWYVNSSLIAFMTLKSKNFVFVLIRQHQVNSAVEVGLISQICFCCLTEKGFTLHVF